MESNDTSQQSLDLEGRVNKLIESLADINEAVVKVIDKYLDPALPTGRSKEDLLRELRELLCHRIPPGCNEPRR